MWEINSALQILFFCYSICLGIIYCLFYDVLRAIRKAIKISDFSVFLQDIFYFVVIAFVTFIFLIATTNGEIRGYIIFAILIGFLVCFCTISKFFIRLLNLIFKGIFTVYRKINGIYNTIFLKTERFFIKIFNLIKNTCKKLLKKVKGLLYTKQ